MRRSSWLLRAFFLFFILQLWLPAPAHYATRSLYDPEGREYAQKLLAALEAAQDDIKNEAVIRLVVDDPNLAKRAFAAIIDLSREDNEAARDKLAEQKNKRAKTLAVLIDEKLADPIPLRLISANILPTKDLIGYLDTLRPPLSPKHYFANRDHIELIDAAQFEILKPLLSIGARFDLAINLENFSTLIKELDAFEPLLAKAQSELMAAGLPPIAEETVLEIRSGVEGLRLIAQAEMGLLDNFESGMRGAPKLAKPAAHQARTWLAGFRAAVRQRRPDKAKIYLAQAREVVATPDMAADPVLEYALRSADFRLRWLQGYRPDQQQLFADFDHAWSALDDYKPFLVIDTDRSWYDGKLASKDWVNELTRYDSYNETAKAVTEQIRGWMGSPTFPRLTADLLQEDQALLQQYEIGGMLAAVFAWNDQVITWSEATDMAYSVDILSHAIETIEGSTFAFLGTDGATGGLLDQYRARKAFLEAVIHNDPAGFVEAGRLAGKVESTDFAVAYLLDSGYNLDKRGKLDEAMALWKQALRLGEKLSLLSVSLNASSSLARGYEQQEDWPNAALYAEKTMATLETAAPFLGASGPAAQEMAKLSREMVDLSARAAVQNQQPAQALAALTRGKELQSAALQLEGQPELRADGRELMLQEQQVAALGQQVERLQALPASPTRDILLSGSESLLADTRAEFLTDTRALRSEHSEIYGRTLKFDPLNLPQVQKSLPADLAVVQYFPTEEALYIFVVTSQDFRLRQVAVSRDSLEATVTRYIRTVRRAQNQDPALKTDGDKIYQLLFAPIAADLAKTTTLVLIPTGRLNSLPFSSLCDPAGVPLLQSHRILELAKPTDLGPAQGLPEAGWNSVVAFANSTGDLPAAGREGEMVAASFPKAQLFSGKQATKAAFLQNGGGSDILHLATHGEWNLEDSLQNYLAMAGNEKVSQDEIFQLDLQGTSIVILSACNSAMGDAGEVGYVASLAEAFWIAGSRSVIATLWSVNDQSTAVLMTEFYKNLKAGDSKVEALRAAQLAVRARPEFAHPFYWAGFVLYGEWR